MTHIDYSEFAGRIQALCETKAGPFVFVDLSDLKRNEPATIVDCPKCRAIAANLKLGLSLTDARKRAVAESRRRMMHS